MKIFLCKIKHVKCDNRGFSMVEVIVSVAIFVMMMTGLYSALSVGDASGKVNYAKMNLQQELRRAMDDMQYDLRQTGSSAVDVDDDGVWQSSITFQVPSGITAGDLTWNTDAITLSVTNNTLQRVQGATTRILGHDISSIQFRRQASSPDILEVDMDGSRTTTSGIVVNYGLDFQVSLRN